MAGRIHTYTGKDATVTWDGARCIHAAACIRGAPQSFDAKARPWIVPNGSSADVLAAAVEACPSGALSMQRPDGSSAMAVHRATACDIRPDGPNHFRGTLVLKRGEERSDETRMALCRCGASANKPFCDNSHKATGFAAPTSLPAAKAPPADADLAAPVTITPTPDGPLQVKGPVTLRDASGTAVFAESAYLCRCGGSKNKPYCDGTHTKIGFKG